MPRRRKPEAGSAQAAPTTAGRFAYAELDRVMHEKARLGILASLAAHVEGLLFNDLKKICALTDGNLSRHLTVLSDAGLVEDRKDTTGNRQQTTYRLTASGKRRFAEYITVLERIVADAQTRKQPRAIRDSAGPGWSTG